MLHPCTLSHARNHRMMADVIIITYHRAQPPCWKVSRPCRRFKQCRYDTSGEVVCPGKLIVDGNIATETTARETGCKAASPTSIHGYTLIGSMAPKRSLVPR